MAGVNNGFGSRVSGRAPAKLQELWKTLGAMIKDTFSIDEGSVPLDPGKVQKTSRSEAFQLGVRRGASLLAHRGRLQGLRAGSPQHQDHQSLGSTQRNGEFRENVRHEMFQAILGMKGLRTKCRVVPTALRQQANVYPFQDAR